jgi:hypothetical protein
MIGPLIGLRIIVIIIIHIDRESKDIIADS